MFWLLPPPYLRWFAAAAVFAAAAFFDLSAAATQPFPFAAESIAQGDPVVQAIEWRDVPRGLLTPAANLDGVAARPIARGEPLTAGATQADGGIPSGWWSVPVPLPDSPRRGAAVRLLAPEQGLDAVGIVAQPAATGAFSATTPGLVAVAPAVAAEVAAAAALDQLIVLLEA